MGTFPSMHWGTEHMDISLLLHTFLRCYRWCCISRCVLQLFHYFHNSLAVIRAQIFKHTKKLTNQILFIDFKHKTGYACIINETSWVHCAIKSTVAISGYVVAVDRFSVPITLIPFLSSALKLFSPQLTSLLFLFISCSFG